MPSNNVRPKRPPLAESRARGPEGAETWWLGRRALHGRYRRRCRCRSPRATPSFRVVLEGASRRNVTRIPSPRRPPGTSQPRPHGPSPPPPTALPPPPPPPPPVRTPLPPAAPHRHASGLTRSLALSLSRSDNRTVRLSYTYIPSPRPRSFSRRHLFRHVSPKPPPPVVPSSLPGLVFLPPFSYSRPFAPLFTVLRRVFGTYLLLLSLSLSRTLRPPPPPPSPRRHPQR